MSSVARLFQFADYVTDRLNPILVKETRQALKSRQFIITFMLLLTVAWLISVFGVVLNGTAIEYGAAGRMFFAWYAGVLGFATLFVVPFGAFRSMLNERDYNTFELLSISTLSPRQIVTGKLLSALVQVLIYYSAIAPFIAFTSLLQGFDLPLVVLVLSIALLWSLFVSTFTIMLSTLSYSRQWQALNTLGMIALLLGQLVAAVIAGAGAIASGIPFDDSEFWWALGGLLVGTGGYLLLAQQIAVSRLTFESGNRSSGLRIISTAQFWLTWVGILAYGWWYGVANIEGEAVFAIAISASIHWVIAGLIFSTESEHISRRVRRNIPRSKLRRLLYAPWLPGGGRGFLLLTLHLAALIVIGRWPLWSQWIQNVLTSLSHNVVIPIPVWDQWIGDTIMAMALYVFIYVGIGAALGRWGQAITPEFRPAHARVFTFLLVPLSIIAPYVPGMFGFRYRLQSDSWFWVANPFSTLEKISHSTSGWSAVSPKQIEDYLSILSVTAAVVLLVNLRALVAGVSDVQKWQLAADAESAVPSVMGTDAAVPG